MEKDKSHLQIRSLIGYVFSVLLLVVMVYATHYIVKNLKRPGQMTLLESQAMDMTAMKAPVGSMPVALETVGNVSFEASVTYSGSVVPYSEQDIVPRIQGQIAYMPFYAGDRVRRNELLVRLDSPDVQKRTEVAAADAYAATATADAGLDEIEQMKKLVGVARAELDAAEADAQYRESELARAQELFDNGAVSRSELEQEKSMEAVARAVVSQKRSGVQAAKNSAEAAALRQKAMRRMADAGARRTEAEKSVSNYLELFSPVDGIVTQRLISPGAVVEPGTALLRVAEISRVRLQASVSESDAALVKIGNPVSVTSPGRPGKTFDARVSAVFPAADPTTRTVIVEAVFDNSDENFMPGDSVTMKIATAAAGAAMSVPESAIVYWGESGKPALWAAVAATNKGKQLYTCTMHPEVIMDKPGNCPKCGMPLVLMEASGPLKAKLVYVVTGANNGERVQILEGLKPGDKIVVDGGEYLSEGDSLFETAWGPNGPKELPPPPGAGGGGANENNDKSAPKDDKKDSGDNSMKGMKM